MGGLGLLLPQQFLLGDLHGEHFALSVKEFPCPLIGYPSTPKVSWTEDYQSNYKSSLFLGAWSLLLDSCRSPQLDLSGAMHSILYGIPIDSFGLQFAA